MSQYSLSTTDPLRKGSQEQARRIRLPWKGDNGVRKQRLYDVGAASLIFDAGTVDTHSSSRANSKMFWSRKHTTLHVGDEATMPTQDEFGSTAAVLGGIIFESPPVSRAGTADTAEMRGKLSGEHFATSDTSLHTPTLARTPSQRGWKIPSPLSASPRWASKRPADVDDETIQKPVTPTTPSALTRVFGIFSRR